MAGETNFTSQFQRVFQGMTTMQKAVVGIITTAVLLALIGVGFWANQDTMGVLFSNLPATDANRIVDDLRKQGVKYDLSQDQRTISVPENRVGELRLKYAGDGLPRGENIGFEKLESPSLTTTDFTQKVMYRRAMEAQLAKTLKDGLASVILDATVHISPANDSPFITEKEDAKASVLLKLRGSRLLPDDNTQAIVNLLAASVEGLKPDKVVVVDQYSRILSKGGRDPMVGASDAQKKLQREEEEYLVGRVTGLLEPVVGTGRVRATAHVELDFDKVKISEEKFDPAGQVERSVAQKDEKVVKRDGASGVPGTPSNVAPATGGGAANATETQDRKETTTNYEISKTVSATEKAPGAIRRMSLAVVVDHATTWDTSGKEPVAKVNPRSAEELKKLRDQVAAAVGIDLKRGDQLTVENIAFAPLINPKEEAEARKQWWIDQGSKLAPILAWTIVGLVVFFMVIMPMLKKLSSAIQRPAPLKVQGVEGEEVVSTRKPQHVKSMAELEAEIEAELNAESATSAPEAQRRSVIKKRLQETAMSDPETAAQLVRSWMVEDGR